MERRELIDVALGHSPADVVIRGGRLVDVLLGIIYPADVAIKGDRIAIVGDVRHCIGESTTVIQAGGKYLTPGLIDTHQHSYESHLSMTEYARVLLPRGTTTVSEAFYGMGIISGMQGVRFCLDELKRTPLKVLFLVPTLAYVQNKELGLVASPKGISSDELFEMLRWPECRGLEEPPGLPIVEQDPVMVSLFEETMKAGKVITGHGCDLNDRELAAYAVMGASCDHECTTPQEALGRLRAGIRISAREGSGARDVTQVIKAITEYGIDPRAFLFCGDEIEFLKIAKVGHLDQNIRLSIGGGVKPVNAVQIATLNPAEYLGISHEQGSVSPGKIADVLIVDDLAEFKVSTVIANGRVVAKHGLFVGEMKQPSYPDWAYGTVNFQRPAVPTDLEVRTDPSATEVTVQVIGACEGTLITEKRQAVLPVRDGRIEPDLSQDILKIAMFDRFGRQERPGLGFVQGFGLKSGALATTYNPLYENVIVVGTNDEDMAFAANTLAKVGGGFLAVQDGRVKAVLELPLFGLLSDAPLEVATEKMEGLYDAVREMGCKLSGPYHNLAFVGVSGEMASLKIAHQGMFDVEHKQFVETVIETR